MIKFLRGSTQSLTTSDIIIEDGQPVVENRSDGTRELKIGDGTKTYSALPSLYEPAAYALRSQIVDTWWGNSNGLATLDANSKCEQVPSSDKLIAEIFIISESEPPVDPNKIWIKPIGGSGNPVLDAHPVGSLYTTIDPTNPSTIFGGTWVSWGGGTTLVSVNESDSDFNIVEKTGGAKTVTLTGDQLPESTLGDILFWTSTSYSGAFRISTSNYDRTASYGSDFGGQNLEMGRSQPHENMPPYTTAYIWKRTT